MKSYLKIKSFQNDYCVKFYQLIAEIENQMHCSEETFVIIDEKVKNSYHKQLKFLEIYPTYSIKASDSNKSLRRVEDFTNWLIDNQATKSATILAIGGGFVQDIATFASHIYYRGIKWEYIPTTLLSQSDSCIGAKCGLNVMPFKNQLGVLHAPSSVYVIEEFLTTLPKIDRASGFGEILKLSLTGEGQFYSQFKDYLLNNRISLDNVLPIINQSLKSKKIIIEIDEYENDLRRILNYGHTFGHALEAATNNKVPHGVAVLFGIDLINFLGLRWGITAEKYYKDINNLIKSAFPDILIPKVSTNELINGIRKDKKIINGQIYFAILNSPGNIIMVNKKIDEHLIKLVEEYLEIYGLFHSA